MHDGAGQHHVEGLLLTLTQNGQRHLGAGRTFHLVDGIVQRHAYDRLAVDAGDAVARLDAGAAGGRAVNGRHHLDQAVFQRDLDADAAELALGGDLHVAIGLGVHVAGVRIKARDHALNGVVDQFAVLDRAHIFIAHILEGVAEQVELGIGTGVIGALGLGQCEQGDRQAADQAQAYQRELLHVVYAFHSIGRSLNFSHGAGLMPWPEWRNSK